MIWNRAVAIGAVVVVALALLVYGFWPEATPVSVEEATRDSLRVTVEEEGQTQLHEEYVVSAPTTGYLKRVPGEAGDSVRRNEVLARLATLPSKVLDASDYQAAEAQVQAARAAVQRAKEERAGAEASFQYAKEEHRRLQRLHEQGTASQQQLERARVEFRQARAAYRSAKQAVAQARGELDAARSRIALGDSSDDLSTRASIRAPVDGRILQVHQESAGVVQAGTPLFTVGTLDSLEVRVDLLSADAVRVTQGTPVEMVRWGGDRTLRGRVRLVEPRGRTEVSALGVEEQRVEVVANVELPAAVQGRLGTGYRVVARFILWDGADVLQVPQSALFRHDGGWAVFAVRDGRAQRQPVTVGRRSGLRVQITEGVTAGTRLVTHPGEAMTDGMRVEVR